MNDTQKKELLQQIESNVIEVLIDVMPKTNDTEWFVVRTSEDDSGNLVLKAVKEGMPSTENKNISDIFTIGANGINIVVSVELVFMSSTIINRLIMETCHKVLNDIWLIQQM